jgi:hypothetical protein
MRKDFDLACKAAKTVSAKPVLADGRLDTYTGAADHPNCKEPGGPVAGWCLYIWVLMNIRRANVQTKSMQLDERAELLTMIYPVASYKIAKISAQTLISFCSR